MDKPDTFQDFCAVIGIKHYADTKTYENINFVWKIIHSRLEKQGVSFKINYESFVNYLKVECAKAVNTEKYFYNYILQEIQRYQSNAEIFGANYPNYMLRLKGYSKSRKCENMNKLKYELDRYLKRVKFNSEHVKENTREFIIMARYICDYLEETPEDIPKDLFQASNLLEENPENPNTGAKPSAKLSVKPSKKGKLIKKNMLKNKNGNKLQSLMQDVVLV
jgi:hypothetical protein